MNKTKIWGAILMSAMIFSLPGCKSDKTEDNTLSTSSAKVGYQLEMPAEGEEIAVINSSEGAFKVRFFPEVAPKAVENFKSLSKKGYYDNMTFHRIIKDFMVQGGDPTGTGAGGESIWGENFEDEFSSSLFNITGSLAMANRGPNTNGSQFFINNQDPKAFQGWENSERIYSMYQRNPEVFTKAYGGIIDMSKITEEIKELYMKHGGSPSLDGYFSTAKKGHTVFGQVFEGMDIVNKISSCETNSDDKPITPITIKNISFENYHKN